MPSSEFMGKLSVMKPLKSKTYRVPRIMTHMRFISQCVGLSLCWVYLLGCTPELNWRETRFDNGALVTLMPCKPDRANRAVPLRVDNVQMTSELKMQGCEAHNMQFTLSQMLVPTAMDAQLALAAWRDASLAALGQETRKAQFTDWALKGADAHVKPVQLAVETETHRVVFGWFMHDSHMYQAAVYGDTKQRDLKETAETYFSGIQLP